MDRRRNIPDPPGWGGTTTAGIGQEAHAHGVIVIVTVTNFEGSQIASIVNSAANRQRAIESCLALMDDHGADGINVDFEFVPKSARDGFVTFMTELTDAVRAPGLASLCAGSTLSRARSWPQPPSTSCPAEWRSLVSTPRRCSQRAISEARSQLGRLKSSDSTSL